VHDRSHMEMVVEQWVRMRREGPVLRVILDRPLRGNAFDPQLAGELDSALTDLDPQVRCVLLQGEGRNFCSGGDLRAAANAPDLGSYVERLAQVTSRALRRLTEAPVPVVGAVQGNVSGSGIGLVGACDIVICGASTLFRPAYLPLGLLPDAGVTWLLTSAFGTPRALNLLLLDEVFDAAEALAVGLVSRVVPDGSVTGEAERVAETLASGAAEAFAVTKRLVREAPMRGYAAQLDEEVANVRRAADLPEAREGVQTFLEHRTLRFPR
jgi:enoyl-CoA hydratase/carnithine racemase